MMSDETSELGQTRLSKKQQEIEQLRSLIQKKPAKVLLTPHLPRFTQKYRFTMVRFLRRSSNIATVATSLNITIWLQTGLICC